MPSDGGVGNWPVGTFQSALAGVTGQKTVNFKPSDIVVELGSITIEKDAVPDDEQDFSFNINDGDTLDEGFVLDDNGNDGDGTASSKTYSDLTPGLTYTIVETDNPDWETTSIVCVSAGGSAFAYNNSGPTHEASVDLVPGDDVTCIFTNTARPGTLIVKKVNPGFPDDTFQMRVDGSIPSGWDPIADGETVSETLDQGTYAVSEDVPGGYQAPLYGLGSGGAQPVCPAVDQAVEIDPTHRFL